MPTIPWPTFVSTDIADSHSPAALRTKIAWLCHLARGRGWLGWMLIAMVRVWADPARTANIVGHYLNADLGVFSSSQIALGFAAYVAAWIPIAAVAYCIWQLFGGYLRGRIFTGDAAAWVQRIGIAGLTAVAVSIVARRIGWLILTSHSGLPFGTRLFTQFVVPNDLLEVLFSLFVLAVGHVFKVAVQIADDTPASCDHP
jgi:Protein of unknown function (DUF2975)